MSANEDLIFNAADGLSVVRDGKNVTYSLPVDSDRSKWLYVTRYRHQLAEFRWIPMVTPADENAWAAAGSIDHQHRAYYPSTGRLLSVALSTHTISPTGVTHVGFHLNDVVLPKASVQKNISVGQLAELYNFEALDATWGGGDSVSISVTPTATTVGLRLLVVALFRMD